MLRDPAGDPRETRGRLPRRPRGPSGGASIWKALVARNARGAPRYAPGSAAGALPRARFALRSHAPRPPPRLARLRSRVPAPDDRRMRFRDRFADFREEPTPPAPAATSATPATPGAPAPRERGRPPAPRPEPTRPELVIGLGNPGADYAAHRHNVGAWCVALLARRHHAQFARQGRMDAAEITIDGRRLGIARPRAYMNESGPAIAAEVRRRDVDLSRVLVIYDDLDLPAGRVRLRLQGGHGGNNGMRSIIASLRTSEFPRVRIGIDRPYDSGQPVRDPDRIADWVLSPPSPADRRLLEAAVERVADAVELAVRVGLEVAMERLNAEGGGATQA